MSTEIWKAAVGWEHLLEVSNLGRVRSIDHWVATGNGGKRLAKGRVRKQEKTCNGYMFVKVSKKYGSSHLAVHRLVAKAFIENPNNYPNVNHKDEVKDNNNVENLEWCNHSYNALYGTCQERLKKYKQKPVEMLDKTTNEVLAYYPSQKDAAEAVGVKKESINGACRGRAKTIAGYKWRYANARD